MENLQRRTSTKFTSKLETVLPVEYESEILDVIQKSCDRVEETWSIFNKNSECRKSSKNWIKYPKNFWKQLVEPIENYNLSTEFNFKDYTCFLKGEVLSDALKFILNQNPKFNFQINFGGDMVIRGYDAIEVRDSGISEVILLDNPSSIYAAFTSGNTNKRGNHIKGTSRRGLLTLISENPKAKDLASLDALCTLTFSESLSKEESKRIALSNGRDVYFYEHFEEG